MAYAKNKKRLSIDLDEETYFKMEDFCSSFNGLTKGVLINACKSGI